MRLCLITDILPSLGNPGTEIRGQTGRGKSGDREIRGQKSGDRRTEIRGQTGRSPFSGREIRGQTDGKSGNPGTDGTFTIFWRVTSSTSHHKSSTFNRVSPGLSVQSPVDATSPVSFQQLTPTQSPISPLNPVFPPFVGIKMRISFPSNRMASDQHPGKSVRTRFNSPGEPQFVGLHGLSFIDQVLWTVPGEAKPNFR
jgi:hypothetical protein